MHAWRCITTESGLAAELAHQLRRTTIMQERDVVYSGEKSVSQPVGGVVYLLCFIARRYRSGRLKMPMLCYEAPIHLGTRKPCDTMQVHILDVYVAVLKLDE